MQLDPDRDYSLELGLDEPDDPASIAARLAAQLAVPASALPPLELRRRSIDARRGRVRFHLVVGALGPELPLGGAPLREVAGPPVIVWIGNVGNEEYLELVREPLQRLARRHDFVLRVIGSREAARLRMEGVKVEVLEWREDREAEWLLGSAIGIMPLHDRDYERGKCSFKLVQYLSAGMPVVASPVGMNTEVVEEGATGFLAATPEDWYAALDRLLADPALRQAMGKRGYEAYRRRFTPAANAQRWLELFRRLQATRGAGAARRVPT